MKKLLVGVLTIVFCFAAGDVLAKKPTTEEVDKAILSGTPVAVIVETESGDLEVVEFAEEMSAVTQSGFSWPVCCPPGGFWWNPGYFYYSGVLFYGFVFNGVYWLWATDASGTLHAWFWTGSVWFYAGAV